MSKTIAELKKAIKAYPKTKNITGLKKAELIALLAELEQTHKKEENEIEGSGIGALFTKTKYDYFESSKNVLRQYGTHDIHSMQVIRTPVQSIATKALNIVSLGAFAKANGYDKLFHLALIAKIGNKSIVIEKFERVNISTTYKISKNTEIMNVNMQQKKLSLFDLMNNARRKVGDKQFFEYDAFSTNCQRFIMDLLESSKLSTPELTNFIMQDVQSIAEKLPSYVPKVAKTITDIANKGAEVLGMGKSSCNCKCHDLKNYL